MALAAGCSTPAVQTSPQAAKPLITPQNLMEFYVCAQKGTSLELEMNDNGTLSTRQMCAGEKWSRVRGKYCEVGIETGIGFSVNGERPFSMTMWEGVIPYTIQWCDDEGVSNLTWDATDCAWVDVAGRLAFKIRTCGPG